MAAKPIPQRHDHAVRRKSQRTGRQRGIRVYIPAEDLAAAGFDPDGAPPEYRTWGNRRGSVLVRLYKP